MTENQFDQFDYERLDVYRCAVEFVRLAMQIAAGMPRGEVDLKSQLRRAAMSIPLNIAEGSGKTGHADRARFHSIARGSAMECGAILDVLLLAGIVGEEQARQGKRLLLRVVSMLSRMSR